MAITLTQPISASKPDSTALIHSIRQAIEIEDLETRVLTVKAHLEDAIRNHHGFLPSELLVPCPEKYARRPLYVDPEGRFSILVMVWAKGQGTPLHDHGGLWVVECLYQGRMRVTNFDFVGEQEGLYQFQSLGTVIEHLGDSDYRIPPDEHHVLENDLDSPSVSIHIFGGNLEDCNIFEPVDGGYRRVARHMTITE